MKLLDVALIVAAMVLSAIGGALVWDIVRPVDAAPNQPSVVTPTHAPTDTWRI